MPGGTAPPDAAPGATAKPRRLRGVLMLAPAAGAVLMALSLTPRSSGYGTHEQLGLPACTSLAATGYPCPTCGLTTSVSAAAHGQVARAFRVHPFGPVLFGALVALAVVGLIETCTGADVLRMLRPRVWWVLAAFGGLLAGWGWKLAAGITSGELPIR